MSDKRPLLGDIKVGDRVFYVTRHTAELYEGVVTKVARVWITVARVGAEELQERFRKDTQDTGDAYGSHTWFETPEQYAWSRRESAAYAFLREQKICALFPGPWAKRRLELANIIRRHEGMEEL